MEKVLVLIFLLAVTAQATLPSDCDSSCSERCKSALQSLEQEIHKYLSESCGQNPPSHGGGRLEFYHSDNCSGDLLASVGPNTDCKALASQISSAVWGIKMEGKCIDIPDTDALTACERFKGGAGGVLAYHSDSCADNALIGSIGGNDCGTINQYIPSTVWAVKLGDKCFDIPDVSADIACKKFKGGYRDATLLYHSDSCAPGDLLGSISDNTDCQELASIVTTNVWGISMNGKCTDIPDADVLSVCRRFGGH